MKRALWIGPVMLLGLALGGCATSGGPSSAKASYGDNDRIDQEKIVSVNKWASDRGYAVTWVNLPQKNKKNSDD
ncbi:hypothetical protein DFR29_116131 [Tahibacter aquaticus]|uniref:Uncharacterized protein n=1 Tax=Tahibacter aquaticus TaxID=520092 RepID=A0A4R6YNZ7_9GAMM|nr:hypothetical protein [Tahibacter aquaticus]TDR39429.1 hypothetical protein DFR29_116131 [Tahibacter aquaticus]